MRSPPVLGGASTHLANGSYRLLPPGCPGYTYHQWNITGSGFAVGLPSQNVSTLSVSFGPEGSLLAQYALDQTPSPPPPHPAATAPILEALAGAALAAAAGGAVIRALRGLGARPASPS